MNKEKKKIKVWITKYALTTGIAEVETTQNDDYPNMIMTKDIDGYPLYFRGEDKEWHRTKESAINKAEEMRVKKIKSLEKQIAKLEKMSFE